ncbi:MAG: PorV/PorQ family protein [Candidatus Cloacimonadota bacterium]|nr:MAG: PorV/PorQ family protein [Candidatus Cloacimonadota bacterium]
MKKAREVIIILILFTFGINLHADEEILDNTGAAFLTIDPFPRTAAMGSAATGICGGITSIFFNPGALVLTEGDVISSTHCEWFQGIRFENIALSHKMKNIGALGVDVKGFYTGGMERRAGDSPEPEGTFGAYFINFGITYSKQLFYFLPVGLSLRGITEKIDTLSAFGTCLDIGLLYRTFIDGLQFGFVLKNLGPEMKFKEEKFKLPGLIRFGAGYRIFSGNLLFSADIEKIGKRKATLNVGSEVIILRTLSIRAGVNGENRKEIGKTAGLSLGAGFAVGDINIDYAFVNYDYLGMTHRFGLTFTPGVTEEEKKRIKKLALEEARKSLREKEKMMSSMSFEKGEELIREGKFDEAINELDISLIWDPGNAKANGLLKKVKEGMRAKEENDAFILGKKAFESGNWLEAITQFDRVLKLNPNNKEAVDFMNHAKNRLEDESLRLAQKEKEKSEDIQSLFNSAVKEYSRSNYRLAITKWQKVLALDPSREDAKSYIAKSQEKLNRKLTSLVNKLNKQIKKKDWLSVISTVKKIKSIEVANKNANAAEKEANREIKKLIQSNLKKAKEFYKQGKMFSSEEYFRIVLRYNSGNKEAKSYLKRIAMIGEKEDADKWYLKGIDAYTKNQFKLAISYWNRCLSIEPEYEKAKKNIERAKKKLAELKTVE